MTVATNALSQTAKNHLRTALASTTAGSQIEDILEGAVTTMSYAGADALKVGGVIIPQHLVLSFAIGPLATITEADLWIAPAAYQVTRIDVVPSTLQGGAMTATICKATGTSAPANGTTPMHTANSIDLNTGAYTVQNVTLTSTTADLILAAGDRIGYDLSAAATAAHWNVSITLKRV